MASSPSPVPSGSSSPAPSGSSSPAPSVPRPARVCVAGPNTQSASAGARIGAEGGNAVDAGIAAALVALVTEPGIVSLAGGAYLTIAPAGGGPVITIDGYVEMPGRDLPPWAFGQGVREVMTEYGGGTAMTVGHGSVATPGALAAFEDAHRRFGHLPWRVVVEPAIEVSRDGFPLGAASDYYFSYVRDAVFGHDPAAHAALHHPDGRPLRAGDIMRIPDLAEFLERVAVEGADALHRGDVARALAAEMAAHGGLITMTDLAEYRPMIRRPATVAVRGWQLATNPPPAIGGPVLASMLHLLDGYPRGHWDTDDLARLVAVMRAVLAHRADRLDASPDRLAAGQALLDEVQAGGQSWLGVAPSTAHVSAVDAAGGACAVTASSGYGSGTVVPGTGLWLNNSLGEHELNRGGLHSLAPGERLASNMAPTVGRREDGAVLAVGSPGADRITSALVQVITSFAHGGYDLQAAVDRPRLHVRRDEHGQELLEHESDLEIPELPADVDLPRRVHPARTMYFGGVAAALRDVDGTLTGAADPRRTGAVAAG